MRVTAHVGATPRPDAALEADHRHGISLLKEADGLGDRVYIPDARKRIYELWVVG